MSYEDAHHPVRWKRWILGALGVAALGALYYFLATLGPNIAAPGNATPAVTTLNAGQYKVSGDIAALERAAEAPGQTAAEQVATLETAIEKQRALNAAVAQVGRDQQERLERLERARASLAMAAKGAELEALLNEAEAEGTAGHAGRALAKYRAALALQHAINLSPADARLKDFARELQLTQRVERGDLAPLAAAVREAEERIAAATDAGDWDALVQALKDAREAQLTINQKFARSADANIGAIDRYDAELARYAARAQRTESDKRERGADAAMEARRWLDATAWYAMAQSVQRELNERFPQSRFASAERVEALEVKRQTAESAAPLDEVVALDREAAAFLRKRQILAAEDDVAKAAAQVAAVAAKWPKSTRLTPGLKLKLEFLLHAQGRLSAWQDGIYAQLLPLPGNERGLILRGPVDQRLYGAVMTDNPSRTRGDAQPVESVTWAEAQEFCQRTGWLLGAVVRLPTAHELEAAVASGAADAQLYARRGSVAEWLQAESAAPEAPVSPLAGRAGEPAGRSAATTTVDKKSRAADRGFRVVVEWPRE
ncbi:SUMF1/EgtB/PvdO family nonheme iron enzyme [Horticoccus luteus]|uniref:SUMF1/EgtB/PvdO family nonheme iron enzyme n=1 Tax=Horticoccus luteus TaxID=2862869 RepID=A0A8F9TUT9_9BACT|nr:SUMF1/EgtB/PvdO family nonheme iron enzyme [Horticoccus luteus]QYM78183.1 SUMF1/EgtB/PvdO family nonheme iron enzyme [Horticoccus luteus]